MPTRGNTDSTIKFQDCVDQIHEIYQKYNQTHDIIIGGDLNEDLSNKDSKNQRKDYLLNFVEECNFQYSCTGKNVHKIKWNGVL